MYWEFPADKLLPHRVGEAMDNIGRGPRRVARLIIDIASHFGIKLSAETCERWLRLWAAAIYCDDLVDDAPPKYKVEALALFERLLRGKVPIDELLPEWVEYRNTILVLASMRAAFADTPQLEQIPEVGLMIVGAASVKTKAPSLYSYAQEIIRENSLSAYLVRLCMTDDELAHPAYSAFERWFTMFAVSVALRDAAADLYDDYASGMTQVRPTYLKYLFLRTVWIVYTAQALRNPAIAWRTYRSVDRRFTQVTRRPTQTRVQKAMCALFRIRINEG